MSKHRKKTKGKAVFERKRNIGLSGITPTGCQPAQVQLLVKWHTHYCFMISQKLERYLITVEAKSPNTVPNENHRPLFMVSEFNLSILMCKAVLNRQIDRVTFIAPWSVSLYFLLFYRKGGSDVKANPYYNQCILSLN